LKRKCFKNKLLKLSGNVNWLKLLRGEGMEKVTDLLGDFFATI
jgi:hypothetical protein